MRREGEGIQQISRNCALAVFQIHLFSSILLVCSVLQSSLGAVFGSQQKCKKQEDKIFCEEKTKCITLNAASSCLPSFDFQTMCLLLLLSSLIRCLGIRTMSHTYLVCLRRQLISQVHHTHSYFANKKVGYFLGTCARARA